MPRFLSDLRRVLSDPSWNGVRTLIALIALIVTILVVSDARSWIFDVVRVVYSVVVAAGSLIATVAIFIIFLWLLTLTIYVRRNSQERSAGEREFIDKFEHGLVNWHFKGGWTTSLEDKEYVLTVTRSGEGGIAAPCRLWNDYIFEFDTKIVRNNSTWIIRASSIAEYVMLQCRTAEIIPHFRTSNVFIRSDSVPLPIVLPLNEWIHIRIKVAGTRVLVTAMFQSKDTVLFDQQLLEPVERTGIRIDGANNQTISFTLDYPVGSVGFRESGKECSQFRNVRVVKI